MATTKGQLTWENLQKEAEGGKISIQMKDGEQLFLQTTSDGKMEVLGVDGELKLSFDWIHLVDPNDPKVIAIAEDAAKKSNVELERVVCGVSIKAFFTTAYCLLISAKDSNGVKNFYFTAVVGSSVLLFQYVMPNPF